MKLILKRIAVALLALLAGIQLWPAGRTNPPVESDLDAPPEVESVLRRACYDCHSNETRWPWYAYVAPVSWSIVHDVDEAREELNFSAWGRYAAEKRAKRAEKAVEEVEEGEMPLASYVRMHPEAAVSADELGLLKRWAEGLHQPAR